MAAVLRFCPHCTETVCVSTGFPREVYETASSGLLRSKQWQFLTEGSGQPNGPILKDPSS
jgi:hypothetical protein